MYGNENKGVKLNGENAPAKKKGGCCGGGKSKKTTPEVPQTQQEGQAEEGAQEEQR